PARFSLAVTVAGSTSPTEILPRNGRFSRGIFSPGPVRHRRRGGFGQGQGHGNDKGPAPRGRPPVLVAGTIADYHSACYQPSAAGHQASGSRLAAGNCRLTGRASGSPDSPCTPTTGT